MVDRNSLDFSFSKGLDFFDTSVHMEDFGTYIPTGYPFIDLALGGGVQRKALYIWVAPPKVGKCLLHSVNIKIRNKKTGNIETITIGDFYKRLGGAANI
jgi:hypothetical protein